MCWFFPAWKLAGLTHTHQFNPIEMNTQGPYSNFTRSCQCLWDLLDSLTTHKIVCEYILPPKFRWWQSKHTGAWKDPYLRIPQRNRSLISTSTCLPKWQGGWKSTSIHHVKMGFRIGKCWFPACSLVCWRVIWVPKYPSIKRLYHKLQM